MHLTFKLMVQLKLYFQGVVLSVLCIHTVFAQDSAPFFLPGLSQNNKEQTAPAELGNLTPPLTIQQQEPETVPPMSPMVYQEDSQSTQPLSTNNGFFLPTSPKTSAEQNQPAPSATPLEPASEPHSFIEPLTAPQENSQPVQPLTTDSGLFLPVSQNAPVQQDYLTQTPQETLTNNNQNGVLDSQASQQSKNNNQQNNIWQPPAPKDQEQQLYFARGADLIKPPAPIVVWKDITPPVADKQFQLLIDPASIIQSPEHPRWRQATVQAKIRPDHYLQWKLTFSCKANAVRYDEIETITQGVSMHENRQFIYFVPITNAPNQQWLHNAYNAACNE